MSRTISQAQRDFQVLGRDLDDSTSDPASRFPLGLDQGRQLEPEMMDDPSLDKARHMEALAGLARINLVSGSARILWRPIKQLARQMCWRPLRVLDVATGSGDVLLRLYRKAVRNDVPLEVTGLDISRRAIAFARRRAARANVPAQFVALNAIGSAIPRGYDVVISSLFLHHLANHQAETLLRRMKNAARRMVLVHDLERRLDGYWLAYFASHLFSNSDVVHTDALRSVRAAFTVEEVRCLARSAGLADATITRRWPCRYLLQWRRGTS